MLLQPARCMFLYASLYVKRLFYIDSSPISCLSVLGFACGEAIFTTAYSTRAKSVSFSLTCPKGSREQSVCMWRPWGFFFNHFKSVTLKNMFWIFHLTLVLVERQTRNTELESRRDMLQRSPDGHKLGMSHNSSYLTYAAQIWVPEKNL